MHRNLPSNPGRSNRGSTFHSGGGNSRTCFKEFLYMKARIFQTSPYKKAVSAASPVPNFKSRRHSRQETRERKSSQVFKKPFKCLQLYPQGPIKISSNTRFQLHFPFSKETLSPLPCRSIKNLRPSSSKNPGKTARIFPPKKKREISGNQPFGEISIFQRKDCPKRLRIVPKINPESRAINTGSSLFFYFIFPQRASRFSRTRGNERILQKAEEAAGIGLPIPAILKI